MTDPVNEIRRLLTERRKTLGLSQRELARRMGCPQSMISDFESGKTANSNLGTLTRWAAALQAEITVTLSFAAVTIPARTEKIRLTEPAQPPPLEWH